MISYLSYETEKREIRIVPINVLELKLNMGVSSRWQPDSFRISFIDDIDAYNFMKFFEVEQEEINWKYIKNNLLIFHKEMKFDFKGCFPTEFTYNLDILEVEIHYDHFETNPLTEQDELVLKSQVRELKLKSIGI
jgi:hypothetical protein